MESSTLSRRQYYADGPGWWYSDTAYIIKWSILAVILVACFGFFLGGYLHARRRMAKGLPPLRYHRWLVPRRSRYAFAQAHPEHAHHFSFYRNPRTQPQATYTYVPGQAYQMGHYGPPPPAYHEPEYVPAYTPAVPNKTDPNQTYTAPPPGDNNSFGLQPPAGPSQPPQAATTYDRR